MVLHDDDDVVQAQGDKTNPVLLQDLALASTSNLASKPEWHKFKNLCIKLKSS